MGVLALFASTCRSIVILAALWAGITGTAAAAPFTLAAGSHPDIAVADDGTAHIVFRNADNNVVYCRLPRGATTCAASSTLTYTGSPESATPFVRLAGSEVVIIETRDLDTYVRSSADGFAMSRDVSHTTPGYSGVGDAELGSGQTLYLIFGPGVVQQTSRDAAAPVTESSSNPGPVVFDSAQLAVFSGTLLQFYGDNSGSAFERTLTGANANDNASWSDAAPLGSGFGIHASSGSAGLFLASNATESGDGLRVAKAGASGFGAPVPLQPAAAASGDTSIFADGGGRVHAIWRQNGSNKILYTVSTNGGVNYPAAVAISADEGTATGPEVATAADGQGFAVWQNASGIRAVPLTPALVSSGSGSGTGSGSGSGTGDPAGDFGGRAPEAPSAPVTITVGDSTFTAGVSSCRRSNVVVKLRIRRVSRAGHVRVVIRKVVFTLDRRQRRTDRHAAYRVKFRLPAATRAATRHRFVAKIYATLHGHRTKRKVVRVAKTFRVC